jgi:hypothetical protein
MFKAQNAFEGVIPTSPTAFATLLRWYIFPLGRPYVVPSDKLGHEVATLLIEPSATRDRLTAGMYLPRDDERSRSASSNWRWRPPSRPPSRSRRHPRRAVQAGKLKSRRGATSTMAALAKPASSRRRHALVQRRATSCATRSSGGRLPLRLLGEQALATCPKPAAPRPGNLTARRRESMAMNPSTSSTARARPSSRRATPPAPSRRPTWPRGRPRAAAAPALRARGSSTRSSSAAPAPRRTRSTSAAWSRCAWAAATRCRAGR